MSSKPGYPPYSVSAAYPPAAENAQVYPVNSNYPPAAPHAQKYDHQQQQHAQYPPPQNQSYNGQAPPPPPGFNSGPAPPNPVTMYVPQGGRPDVWATILFSLLAAIFGGACAFMLAKGIPNAVNHSVSTSKTNIEFGNDKIGALCAGAATAFGYSLFSMFMFLNHSKTFVWTLIGITLVTFLLFGIALTMTGGNVPGIVTFIVFLITAFFIYRARKHIPFAATLFEISATVIKKHFGLVVSSFLASVLQVGIVVFYGMAVGYSVYALQGQDKESMQGTVAILLLFPFIWISQVIIWSEHVIVCGVFASYFFVPQNAQNPHTVLSSTKRALGHSFGPICYGSLIIAIIEFLKALAHNERSEGGGSFVACLFECILSCIGDILEFINLYAFVQVAIYGKSFCTAAKDTWTLMKDRGIELLVNNNISGMVLKTNNLVSGMLSGGVCLLVLYISGSLANIVLKSPEFYGILVAVAASLLLGILVSSLLGGLFVSGIAALFVSIAEDPSALFRNHPEHWQKIRETNPDAAFFGLHNF